MAVLPGKWSPVVLVQICVLMVFVRRVMSYTTCTDSSLNFKGYTYNVDPNTGDKVWSHCKFPNPKFDAARCGITGSTDQHFVCDPDYLISSQVVGVDTALKKIQSSTSTLCSGPDGVSQSYIVAMALINRIRIPNTLDSSTCINDCGEIYPALNSSVRMPTNSEKTAIMANFANYLKSGWGLGACGNDVLMLYCKEFDMLYVTVGYKAADLVTDSVIATIKSTFSDYKNAGRIADGLLLIAEDLRLKLRHITPAHVILIINVLAVLAFAAFLFFFLHLRELEYNVWGREGAGKVVGYVLYVLSGAWIINGLMYFVLLMSMKMPYWGLLMTLIAGLATVILYILEDKIFPETTVSIV